MRNDDWIDQLCIRAATKGVPDAFWGHPAARLRTAGLHALAGDVPTPFAVLKSSALANNLDEMARFAERHGLELAPHGKTSLSPALFQRQMAAGAWGMTVASVGQAALCQRAGIHRMIIANQITDAHNLTALVALLSANPECEVYFLVDSVVGADCAERAFSAAGLSARVLIEMGQEGGRCGCRTIDQAIAVARHIATLPHVSLCGVEGFEGLFFRDRTDHVDAFLSDMKACLGTLEQEGLLASEGPILLTAGGSAYFDLVARAFGPAVQRRLVRVLRSGCYITHDDGFYAEQLPLAQARGAVDGLPQLKPALEVWASVLSCPEPGLAILNAGKRDLGFDIDYPVPRQHVRPGEDGLPRPLSGATLFQLSDQHGFVRLPEGADVAVGDMIALGISHPCTTFDKWPVLLEVDNDYGVLGAISTFF